MEDIGDWIKDRILGFVNFKRWGGWGEIKLEDWESS